MNANSRKCTAKFMKATTTFYTMTTITSTFGSTDLVKTMGGQVLEPVMAFFSTMTIACKFSFWKEKKNEKQTCSSIKRHETHAHTCACAVPFFTRSFFNVFVVFVFVFFPIAY